LHFRTEDYKYAALLQFLLGMPYHSFKLLLC